MVPKGCGVGGNGEILNQRVQTFSYKINEFWGSNVQHGDIIADNIVLYTWKLLREEILNVFTIKKKW